MGLSLSIPLSSIFEAHLSWATRQSAQRYRLLAIRENRVRTIQIRNNWDDRKKAILSTLMAATIMALVTFLFVTISSHGVALGRPGPVRTGAYGSNVCDTPEDGFICNPNISHSWGQYSPYFSVPSQLSSSIPPRCEVTFAQVLSRHGARDPTLGKSMAYKSLIEDIQRQVTYYGSGYEFLKDFEYTLGSDQLSLFGEEQMVNSGIKFYKRYQTLGRTSVPFIRASGQDRVVRSAEKFTQGYHSALRDDPSATAPHDLPYKILTIPESPTSNNTLNHGLCNAFESPSDYYSHIGAAAQSTYLTTFATPLIDRLNANLQGYTFTPSSLISLMDLCPFTSVATPYQPSWPHPSHPPLSPFCTLFTPDDWLHYDYYQTLGKWYGYGPGNPLGPTQGVGYVNELIARITGRPVDDHTSSNSTLDGDGATFPLGRRLYADFSHDNDMVTVFGALELYPGEGIEMGNGTRMGEEETGGFSARWTVPFAGRVYFEKMDCGGEEFVRVLVNDRVVRLKGCKADGFGMCKVDEWVDSLGFARGGGRWDVCFEG